MGSQADLVLQPSSYLWSADRTTTPSRSLQLRGWIRKLAGRLVCGQEGMVLQSSWKGLSEPRRRLCHGRAHCAHCGAIRLRCWIRQLDGRLVCGQEGLVLFEQRQGLPTGSWRLRLSLGLSSGRCMTFVLALGPSSGTMACFVASKSLLRIGHEMAWHRRLRHLPVLAAGLVLIGVAKK